MPEKYHVGLPKRISSTLEVLANVSFAAIFILPRVTSKFSTDSTPMI